MKKRVDGRISKRYREENDRFSFYPAIYLKQDLQKELRLGKR